MSVLKMTQNNIVINGKKKMFLKLDVSCQNILADVESDIKYHSFHKYHDVCIKHMHGIYYTVLSGSEGRKTNY